jgi:hypothetical protein
MIWDFDRLSPVLNEIGMAAAEDRPLDVDQLARELDERPGGIQMFWITSTTGPGWPSSHLLTRAGSQYLACKGEVPEEVLRFLPGIIDDLHARQAMINAGTVLIDEFRHQIAQGHGARHAANLVPDAFSSAVNEFLAVNLFAAAAALLARLSCGRAAGCLAEEVMAVALLEQATVWLEMEADTGELEPEEADAAQDALRGIFELFEDDDVLALYEMEEPADAAIAGHSWINRQAGVVDQRLEAWFRPFGGVPGARHLTERSFARGE